MYLLTYTEGLGAQKSRGSLSVYENYIWISYLWIPHIYMHYESIIQLD